MARPEDWPGVFYLPEDFGRTITVQKPEGAFFGGRRPKGHAPTYPPARQAHDARLRHEALKERREETARDRARGRSPKRCKQLAADRARKRRKQPAPRPPRNRDTLPETVTVTISRPPGYDHLSLAEVRAYFRELLDARVAQIHADRQAEGLTHFMGIEAAMAIDPLDSLGDTFPTFARDPRIACRFTPRRIALLEELQSWRLSYQKARERWCGGDRTALFPHGSYWLPFFHGAETAAPTRAPPFA